jgi:RHS repeat-associated protein
LKALALNSTIMKQSILSSFSKRRCVLLLLGSLVGIAFTLSASAQIMGPATANTGATSTYTYSDGSLWPSQNWDIVNGDIASQSQSGTTYTVNVKWTCNGMGVVNFKNGTGVIATKNVTVSCGLRPTPNTTFTYSNQCSSTTITRTTNPATGMQWYWQTDPAGTRTDLGSGTTLTVTTPGTYYLRTLAYCCWSASSQATSAVAVTTLTPPTASGIALCGPGVATLTATMGSNGTSVRWYSGDVQGNRTFQSEGLTFSPTVSSSQTYYARTYNSTLGCESGETAVVVTVNTLPSNPASAISTPASLCGTGTVTLSATGAVAGQTYAWYAASSGGSAISTSQTLSATATFYVALVNSSTGCEGGRTSVTVSVNPQPQVFSVTGTGTYCTSGSGMTVTLSGSQTSVSYQLVKNGTNTGTPLAGTGNALNWTSQTAGTYTVVATNTNGSCATTMTGSAVVTASPVSVGGTVSGAEVYGTGSGTLTLTGHTGAPQRWEKNPGTGWTTIANTTTSNAYSNVTQTTQYRAYVKSGVCSEAVSAIGTVSVFAVPVISVTGPLFLAYGGSSALSTGSYTSYQWTRNGTDIAGATLQTFTAREPGVYQVKVKGSSTAPVYTATAVEIKATLSNQPAPVNYVSTTQILKKGVQAGTSLYTLLPEEVAQQVNYQDGLGRTFQTVSVGQATGQFDVISPVGYGDSGLPDTTYLPYTFAGRDGRMHSKALRDLSVYSSSEQYQFYQQGTGGLVSDQYPFAITKYKSKPTLTINEQGAPGQDWQPGSHTVKQTLTLNAASLVHNWKPDGTTAAYYGAKELLIQQTVDENGNAVKLYSDKAGRTVLKQVQVDETLEGVAVTFLETYFIYDALGQLKYVLPPKAVSTLGTGAALDANAASVAEFIFTFKYDNKGRLTEKKVPGAVPEYFVYDNLDRLVLKQDGTLRTQNKWMIIKYDVKNRPVYAGIYLNTTETTLVTVQGLFNTRNYDTEPYFEIEEVNATYQGYSNRTFPTAGITLLQVNYYDHYDFDRNGTADYTYDNTHLAQQEAAATSVTRGLVTGSKMAILTGGTISSTWLVNALFYDTRNRVVQQRKNNHLYPAGVDKTTTVYDFAGKVKSTRTTQQSSVSATVSVVQRFVYDHAGRVLQVFQTNDAFAEQQIAQYTYNTLGQLIDKQLHNTGSQFLQSVDYRYTIRGWLSSINNASLTSDGVTNDDTNDFFGLEMAYNKVDASMGNTPYYNGNISSLKWKTTGAPTGLADQRSYKYTYDKSNKLKTATFQAYGTTAWNKEAGTLNENPTFDRNGNLKTISRQQNLRALSGTTVTSTPQTIDNLTYTYTTGNQLSKVEDTGTTAGFNNGALNGTNEYTYATDGSLTKDDNKGISTIAYNILGKPQQMTFTDGTTVVYNYDAAGIKLTMSVTKSGTTTTTDYVGGFVYTNSALSFFGAPEGRVVKNGATYEHQYALTDHQGNTRVVFTSATPAPLTPNASFEGDANDKSTECINVVAGNVVSFVAANHTTGGTKVVRMNQTYKVGPSKSLKVFPGDKVDLEVWEYHESGSGYGTTSTPSTTLINLVASAFGGVSGGPGESGLIFSGVNSAITGFITGGNQGDSRPAAYLNYILFDANYKVLDMGWQLAPATTFTKQKLSFPTITIKEAGTLFTYLSYDDDSNNWVYFDDLKVSHTQSNLIQVNEYYPFGLQTANSWTRVNALGNAYLYNEGSELNNTTAMYDLPFRNYDAALGRFMQVDPLATMAVHESPYGYASNSPVFKNDPTGLLSTGNFWRLVQRGLNSEYGGSWSESDGYHEFRSGEDAYFAVYNQVEPTGYRLPEYTSGGKSSSTYKASPLHDRYPIWWRNGKRTFLKNRKINVGFDEVAQQGEPTRENGGFIDGDKFYDYMKIRAQTWKIEVAAIVLKDGDDYKYFILPWKNNTVKFSDTYVEKLSEVLPGYTIDDISSWVHTHNMFGDPMPSPGDKLFGDKYKRPVYVIAPKVDYVYEKGVTSEYEGF